MSVKLHRCLGDRAPTRALAPWLVALALIGACGDPDDGNDVTQVGNPAQNGDAGFVDTGVGITNPPLPDAGNQVAFDSGIPVYDAGSPIGSDASGPIAAIPDAGASDSGNLATDAGASSDAGADAGDAGGCALTYENFGKMFMTTYCVSCHTGATARRMVQLDTLAGVQKNKTAVKRLAVTNTTMPEGNPKPASAERQKLGQWLDCGPL